MRVNRPFLLNVYILCVFYCYNGKSCKIEQNYVFNCKHWNETKNKTFCNVINVQLKVSYIQLDQHGVADIEGKRSNAMVSYVNYF